MDLRPRKSSLPDAVLGTRLLEPDVMMKAQWDARRLATALRPEQRLALAILEDAVRTYQQSQHIADDPRHRRARAQREAVLRWFLADDDEYVFSFVNCCGWLPGGPDPSALRDKLLAGMAPLPRLGRPANGGRRHLAVVRPSRRVTD